MTTGSTNHATSGAPDLDGHLDSAPEDESALGEPIEAAAGEPNAATDTDSWRVEVAAKLERYRNRRKPRTPRYPSLLLPFDAPESWSRSATLANAMDSPLIVPQAADPNPEFLEQSSAETTGIAHAHEFSEPRTSRHSQSSPDQFVEQSGKVIEFPRSAAIPVFHSSDLAGPVLDHDRPRIVEAPEILPPPPALGGMLLEPAKSEAADRRAVDALCLDTPASIMRRAAAALVDGLIQAVGLGTFAAIFVRLNPSLNPRWNLGLNPRLSLGSGTLLLLAFLLAAAAALLWMAYEFLFIVYTGSTPGLRAAKLRVARFDGSSVNRRWRRWRVLTSFLSAYSAGLGYLWCFFDQDGLCWHDRITRTYIQRVDDTAATAPQP